jgi:hypothetical protein
VDALWTATERGRLRSGSRLLRTSLTRNNAALADLRGSILSSLRNHKGNGIQRANEGSPARWRLTPN